MVEGNQITGRWDHRLVVVPKDDQLGSITVADHGKLTLTPILW
jgi:hypothetical protein